MCEEGLQIIGKLSEIRMNEAKKQFYRQAGNKVSLFVGGLQNSFSVH